MTALEFSYSLSQMSKTLQPFALKLTKDREEANDLLQETMLKAYTNRDKFAKGTNLKAWLYTIMKNTFINAYRKKKNQNTFVDETDNKYFINMGETEKSVQTDAVVDREYMMKQINSVEKTYVETFMMYYNGYKYEEIAEILEIPLGTVKSRIFLARRKMMDKLKDYR